MSATLGQRLRALRKERGLSQSDLAGDLVSPSYVSLIESGQRSPEREVLEGLARKLDCSVLYLESGVAPEEITEQRLKLQFAEIALASGSAEEARAASSPACRARITPSSGWRPQRGGWPGAWSSSETCAVPSITTTGCFRPRGPVCPERQVC